MGSRRKFGNMKGSSKKNEFVECVIGSGMWRDGLKSGIKES